MRTTIDLDEPVLRDLKRLQAKEGKTLGQLVSELLARALSARKAGEPRPEAFRWLSRPMDARVSLADKEAIYGLLDTKTTRPRR